jgi:hypothetical protein
MAIIRKWFENPANPANPPIKVYFDIKRKIMGCN